jgi:hypothetical protein
MKSIFPSAIDGDLLRLVHLSNGFKIVEGATPLEAGDRCKAKARISSVINTDAGKVVKIKGLYTMLGPLLFKLHHRSSIEDVSRTTRTHLTQSKNLIIWWT